jgi:uncharacterized protein (TIGR03067 family)
VVKPDEIMRAKIAGGLLTGAILLIGSARAADSVEAGFQPLFNGKDLSGWEGNTQLWSARDGAIVGQTTAEKPAPGNTFLIWKGTVGDFELRCSYKITPNNDKGFANSGIQYRSQVLDKNGWVVGGYQADLEAGDTYTGILYEERMTRQIMAARGEKVVWDKECTKQVKGSLGNSAEIQAAIRKGDWNDYVIIAKGNHLQHFVNGKQTIDVIDDCETKRAMTGVLALQLHAGQPMTVQFRNLRLKAESADAAGGDLARLQGDWQISKFEANGDVLSSDEVGDLVVTIKGNNYKLTNSDRTDHGTFSLDSSKSPAQMDIRPESGPDQGEKLPAIYEFDGQQFRVCYGRAGGERPASFAAPADSGQVLITYKKKKAE